MPRSRRPTSHAKNHDVDTPVGAVYFNHCKESGPIPFLASVFDYFLSGGVQG
jgi:hypothetical protein